MSIGDIRAQLQYAAESQFRLVEVLKGIETRGADGAAVMQEVINARRTPLMSSAQQSVPNLLANFIQIAEEVRDRVVLDSSAARQLAEGSTQQLRTTFEGSQHAAAHSAIVVSLSQQDELNELSQVATNLVIDAQALTGFVTEDELTTAAGQFAAMQEYIDNVVRNSATLLSHINDYLSDNGLAPLDIPKGH